MATTIEATDGVTGQMYSNPQTVGQMSKDSANQWHQFFGPPAGEIKTNPYDKYQYETYTLPDAYRGKNIFVRDTIEGFLDSTNNWYTSVALPIQVTDQLHVRWNEFRFDQALASIVPEEGISRLITSSKEAREDHTIRHGLAFVLEHGFMTTEEGRRQYALNIQQIAQSVQETNNYDVISAILNCREYEREWEKRHSMIRTPWNDLGKREVMEFGIVQKDFRGFEILHEKYKHRLNRYGVQPTMWIFPPGLALYSSFDPLVADYNKESRGIELQTGPEVLGSFRGLNVFETREFDVRQGELPINLLQRRVQIGEHYYMRSHHSDNKKYVTNLSMDIVVYNEDRDDWEKISFRDAVNHCHRFKADGTLNTDDFVLDPPADDLFTYKSTDFTDDARHQWCDAFGQMEDKNLPAEALRAFCETAAKFLGESVADEECETMLTFNETNDDGTPISYECGNTIKTKIFKNMIHGNCGLISRPRLYTLEEKGGKNGQMEASERTKLLSSLSSKIREELNVVFFDGDAPHKDMQVALGMYLTKHGGVKKGEARTLVTSAKFAQVLGELAAEQTKRFKPVFLSNKFRHLNMKVASGEGTRGTTYYVYHDGEWIPCTKENSHRLLPLCHIFTMPKMEKGPVAGGMSVDDAFASLNPLASSSAHTIGSKRSMTEAPRAWKRRGISDFTSEFAPVGASADKMSANYVEEGTKGSENLDYYTFNHGLEVNGKNKAFAAKIATLSTNLQKCIAMCLYCCKINGTLIQHWMNHNIMLPFSVIVARPFMTYDMCTCVMMKGGSDTGATFQGHSDFQLGDDVQSKIHYGNYTYYSKAIVTNHKNIIHARNIMANGYVGGDGTSWRNSRTDKGDMCAFLVPFNEHKKSNPLRVFSVDDEKPDQSMTGANFYARVYGQAALPSDQQFSTMTEQEDSNDITYMGHHFWWKPHREQTDMASGSYTGVTINTGHWGPKVYPGCGRVRAGDEIYLKDPDYGQEVF